MVLLAECRQETSLDEIGGIFLLQHSMTSSKGPKALELIDENVDLKAKGIQFIIKWPLFVCTFSLLHHLTAFFTKENVEMFL